MADWKLNYGINLHGPGTKKLKCNLTTKGGNGLQLVMGGSIPKAEGASPEDAVELVKEFTEGLDGLDSDDPANHVKYLEAIAGFSTKLANLIKGK